MIREIVGYFSDLKSKKKFRSKTLKLIFVIFVHYDVTDKNPKTTPTKMLSYTTNDKETRMFLLIDLWLNFEIR